MLYYLYVSYFIGLRNPIDAIYHIQPIMAALMVFLAFSLEGKIFFVVL